MEQTNQICTESQTEVLESNCRSNELEDKPTDDTSETVYEKERRMMLSAAKSLPAFDQQMARQHPLKILLAEDSMVNVKIALWFLKKLGYHADVVFNGIEAIDALNRRSYDVILMDAEMPEMDGRQATALIRKIFSAKQQPHIIAMTANSAAGDREEYLSIGMDDYISKPLKIEDMIKALLTCRPSSVTVDVSAMEMNDKLQALRMAC
jgi:CheY-like chemotaxis protein